MASPPLYWNFREMVLSKSDILSAAKQLMEQKGMSNIVVSSADVSGRTASVHAVIGPVKKKDPPGPAGGVGTNTPPTYIVVFMAAGTGAKAVRDNLVSGWEALVFL